MHAEFGNQPWKCLRADLNNAVLYDRLSFPVSAILVTLLFSSSCVYSDVPLSNNLIAALFGCVLYLCGLLAVRFGWFSRFHGFWPRFNRGDVASELAVLAFYSCISFHKRYVMCWATLWDGLIALFYEISLFAYLKWHHAWCCVDILVSASRIIVWCYACRWMRFNVVCL